VAFAIAMASASVSKRKTGRERAEDLFGGESHVLRGPGQDGGLKERAAQLVARSAQGDRRHPSPWRRPAAPRPWRPHPVDQRALRDPILAPVADLEFARLGHELLDEGIMDPGLHVEAVGADAGLAGVAVLRDDRPLHGLVQIGIVEHDEGRVAAQFHRHLLHRVGRLADQLLADLGRAGEGDLAHLVTRHHRPRDGPRRARQDVHRTLGIPTSSASAAQARPE
jgi:hypothetical protein